MTAAAVLLCALPAVRAEDEAPAGPGDSRVVEFFLPGQFLEARMQAMETNRSLLIKGVAFGMDESGATCATKGTWGSAGDMLRGGPLSERRVIDLIRRRFVAFYFSVEKGRPGYDEAAAKYIAAIDDRFAGDTVPTPPVWIVSPEGELFTTIDVFADKRAFHAALLKMLGEHYEMNLDSPEETAVLSVPQERPGDAEAWLAAAELLAELGRDEAASAAYTNAAALRSQWWAPRVGLCRLARWRQDWSAADAALRGPALHVGGSTAPGREPGRAVEAGLVLIGKEEWQRAREELAFAIDAFPGSRRLGEMHFYAGVAAFRLGQRDRANYHWCWVLENLPDDNHYMRCHVAATADAMPHPNPELGGYKGDVESLSRAAADAALEKATADYERLKNAE